MREPLDELQTLLGSSLTRRIIDRLAYAHDASLYRLVPQAIVRPRDIEELRTLFAWCQRHGRHCTFRTGGTSLSGQAVTDGILVDLSRGWSGVEILDDGHRVRMQPGVTGARVNAHLHRYGRKLGPDPASLMAAMVGGIVANNASGMCCGTAQNSYHTLDSMAYVLADGTRIDTSTDTADEQLHKTNPPLHAAIAALRDEVRADADLVRLIRRKYLIKNTIGYSLNALVDEDEPARIIARLLVGSEGTLGFIEHVTLRTVSDASSKQTALIVYDSLESACERVEWWRQAGAAAIELMDDASMRSFSALDSTPEEYRIDQQGAAALLVEFHDCQPPDVDGIMWTSQPKQQAALWKLRKGLMPTVGAMRAPGSTMINEDIAAPPDRLAALVRDVQGAFREFGYNDGIVFGHAKDGNIHFVVCQDFSKIGEIDRYAAFMERIAEIVVDRHAGSLKAEHGTGRNMAPFVEREWGARAYEIMQRIKVVLDPMNVLNRDVIINTDPLAHVRNIKPVPILDGEIGAVADACIECGFCEHVCPTRNVTLTPRQRIVVEREMVLHAHDVEMLCELKNEAKFDVVDSCAVDGICATVCPVGIDTGSLVKKRRNHGRISQEIAGIAARNMHSVRLAARMMLRIGRFVGAARSTRLHGLSVPQRIATSKTDTYDLLYVPTCVSAICRHDSSERSLQETILMLARVAGIRISTLSQTDGCCGQPLSSQGLHEAAEFTSATLMRDIRIALAGRSVPVLLDTSTCAAAIARAARAEGITIIDQVGFAELLLPRLPIEQTSKTLVVHPGCGAAKLGTADRLVAIARQLSSNVILPPSAACCGMGGMHGLAYPNVVQAATAEERTEISSHPSYDASTIGISVNTLCESALSVSIGIPFKGLMEAIAEVLRY
ncbi:MAG: FAD-binding oxidoreductase [Candidatus Kapabacteria bacterium]|nr:FAD-binding oxidoreductase [Candidatus Kapabacteria bacterium]